MARFGIYYFSGTGNSLYAAKKLESLLPLAVLAPMSALASLPDVQKDFDAIVFVFPVYFLALPDIIREYIIAADFGSTQRFYAVLTHGGDPGNTQLQLRTLLQKKGKALGCAVDLPMGDNSVVLRTPSGQLAQRIGKIESVLSSFVEKIGTEHEQRDEQGTLERFRAGSYALGKTYELIFNWYFHSRKGRADREKCTGCGVCAKLCPVSNIVMTDGRPEWGKKCVDCFACINRCPQNAVHLGRIHPKSKNEQYCDPGIKDDRCLV